MYIGVDYYPEQWDKGLLHEDLKRMNILGLDLIRIAEFAWHIFEPEEGVFDFSFFDEVIKIADKYGLKVIMGTPTATMPAWLANKYPEVISENEFGRKRVFGGRRQYCFNSPIYLRYSQLIVNKLAEHYGKNTNIIGWQIDNEFGHEGSDMCFCDICHKSFQEYLKAKYLNIDKLNEVYGTVFWSQIYNDFNEIPTPKPTITTHNPSLLLDFYRFRAAGISKYAKAQIDILKNKVISSQFVIHNFPGGLFDKAMDFVEMGKDLDVIGYDNYPVWGGLKEPVAPHSTGFALDLMRGMKQKNFWVLEQLIGAQGHQIIGYLPRPNQAAMWSAQSVAHGADNIVFFRYRAAVKGAEQFCYGIIDHDNKSGKKYDEVKNFIKEMRKSEDCVHSEIRSDVALLYDMDNVWSWKIQPQSSVFDYLTEAERLYAPFFNLNAKIDVLSSGTGFSKYKVILLPVMMLLKDDLAEKLETYISNGGTVIFTFRAGIKDIDNNIIFNKENIVHKLAGLKHVEFESLQEGQFVELESINSNKKYEGYVWRDLLKCGSATPILTYTDKFYKQYAAVTENNYGKGKVYYIGVGLCHEALKNISEKILKDCAVDYTVSDDGLEVYKRSEKIFIINHTDKDMTYRKLSIKPYEFKIIERSIDEI